jgi:hypothetical protein
MAQAHTIGNKAEAACRRGALFDKHRKLMEAWAAYCASTKSGKLFRFARGLRPEFSPWICRNTQPDRRSIG